MGNFLGEILVEEEYLTKEELETYLKKASKSKLSLGQFLISEGILTKEQVGQALSKKFNIPYLSAQEILNTLEENKLDSIISLSEKLNKPIKQVIGIMKFYKAIPLKLNDNEVSIVIVPPIADKTYDILDKFFGSNIEIKYYITTEQDFSQVILEKFFEIDKFSATDRYSTSKSNEIRISSIDLLSEELSAENFVNALLYHAIKNNATDIHIVNEPEHCSIRYRIYGSITEVIQIPKQLADEISTRIKVLAEMDISEKRRPQDGQFEITVENQFYSIRVSSTGTIQGENLFLRLLYRRSLVKGLDALGMTHEQIEIIRKMIKKPYGIIVVTGPTGSGKTTTLYAILKEVYEKKDKNIITIEDPVEYEFKGLTQIQINPKANITFLSSLRSALRQDPDVILVGEIRDSETMHTAIDAALSGHLVLSTFHANNAIAAIPRFVNMGANPVLLSSALNCIISQRLARVWDDKIKDYIGRTGIFEILIIDRDIKRLIADNKDETFILEYAKTEKEFKPMKEIAKLKIKEKIITKDEIERVLGEEINS